MRWRGAALSGRTGRKEITASNMNWTHLHLALNHVPVLGSLFVALLLIAGIARKSEELKRMSLWWFVILGAFTRNGFGS